MPLAINNEINFFIRRKQMMLTDEEIERIIEGDKDYSDLSMLLIALPMIVLVIVMIIYKFI